MGAPKGNCYNPTGRPVGAIGKATGNAREAIAKFVDGNAERLNGWLDAMAETDPEGAFKAFMSVVEYHLPKISRLEHTGKDGERLQINVVTGVPAIDAEFKEVLSSDSVLVPAPAVDAAPVLPSPNSE